MSRPPINLADVVTTVSITSEEWGHLMAYLDLLQKSVSTATGPARAAELRHCDRVTRPLRDRVSSDLRGKLSKEQRAADESYWQHVARYPVA